MSEVPSPEIKMTPPTEKLPVTPDEIDPVVAEVLNALGAPPTPEATGEVGAESGLASRLGLDGLRLAINERRQARAEKKADKLSTSLDAHMERPDVFSRPGPNKKKPGRLDYRETDPAKIPVTLSERRQDARNGRRQAKADRLRYDNQYRLKEVWGSDIGTAAYEERIKSERRGVMSRRRALKAGREFQRLQKGAFGVIGGIEPRQRRVERSARGEDIPGRIIRNRLQRKTAKAERLAGKVEALKVARNPVRPEMIPTTDEDLGLDTEPTSVRKRRLAKQKRAG